MNLKGFWEISHLVTYSVGKVAAVALRVSACAHFPHDFLPSVLPGTAILIQMEKLGGGGLGQMGWGRADLHPRESGQLSLETGTIAL